MRRLLSATVVSILLAAGAPASAQEAPFGERGHTIVVLDHLGGFVHVKQTSPDTDTTSSGANYFGTIGLPPVTRIGVHQVVAPGVTIGTGVHYYDLSESLEGLGSGSQTIWGFSPRVGFIIPVDSTVAVWMRVGASYYHISNPGQRTSPDTTLWFLTLGGEVQLVVTPVSHFGVTLGPLLEAGVAGNQSRGDQSQAQRLWFYGGTVGLVFDF
jgi:hypothetical protein